MFLKRFFQSLVFAGALALAWGGISAEPAGALPRDRCMEFLHRVDAYSGIAQTWLTHATVFYNQGLDAQGDDAMTNFLYYDKLASSYTQRYLRGC